MLSALVASAAVSEEGHIEHDRAVDLALAGGVLGDAGESQLIRALAANWRSNRLPANDLSCTVVGS
jgi:hypothetical protein